MYVVMRAGLRAEGRVRLARITDPAQQEAEITALTAKSKELMRQYNQLSRQRDQYAFERPPSRSTIMTPTRAFGPLSPSHGLPKRAPNTPSDALPPPDLPSRKLRAS